MRRLLLLLLFASFSMLVMSQPPRRIHEFPSKQLTKEQREEFVKKAKEFHVQRQIKEVTALYERWTKASYQEKREIEVDIMLNYSQVDRNLFKPNKDLYVFMRTLYDEDL